MTGTRKRLLIASAGAVAVVMVLSLLSYRQQLKTTLLASIAARITATIGQGVSVRDASFGPSGICLSGIEVDSPDGFGDRKLLRIESLCADIRYRELLRGRFSFSKVAITRPLLVIVQDAQGRINMSDRLRDMMRRKGSTDYLIDLLEVSRGEADISLPEHRAFRSVSVSMRGLSSKQGSKISCRAVCTVPDVGTVTADGWFFLDNGVRKVGIDLSSRGLSLAGISALAGLGLPDRKVDLTARAEGDAASSLTVSADFRVHEGAAFTFFRKRGELRGTVQAVWDAERDSLKLNHAEILAGDSGSARLSGTIRNISAVPTYEVAMVVPRFDLSALPMKKGQELSGELSSEGLVLRGSAEKAFPAVEGGMQLRSGAWKSAEAVLNRIEADVSFLRSGVAAHAEVSAELEAARDVAFSQPVAARCVLDAERAGNALRLGSVVTVGRVEAHSAGRRIAFEKAGLQADVTVKGPSVAGTLALDANGLLFGENRIGNVKAETAISAGKDEIILRGVSLKTDQGAISASVLALSPVGGADRRVLRMTAVDAAFPGERAEAKGLNGSIEFAAVGERTRVVHDVRADAASFRGFTVHALSSSGKFTDTAIYTLRAEAKIAGGNMRISLRGKNAASFFPLEADCTAGGVDAGALSNMIASFGTWKIPYTASGMISQFVFQGVLDAWDTIRGTGSVRAGSLSLAGADGRFLVKDIGFQASASFAEKDVTFESETKALDTRLAIDGGIKRFGSASRVITARVRIPDTKAQDLRMAFWDAFPDKLLYAGLDGALSADVILTSNKDETLADGSLVVRNLTVEGENGEFTLGPVNGVVPVLYRRQPTGQDMETFQGFDRESFSKTLQRLKTPPDAMGQPALTIKSFRYGFKLLEDITIWMRPEGSLLNVERFSATIFGGKIIGLARVALSEQTDYRVGAILDNVSLDALCNEIEPIRGYISGRISGSAFLRGNGVGLGRLTGKADFWTHQTGGEKTKISREFLEKIGGPTVRAYLGERRFNKGVMSLYIQDGYLTFRELEISNRNLFGVQDLSVKVAPYSNRIAIEHLLWTILQAAERAKSQ